MPRVKGELTISGDGRVARMRRKLLGFTQGQVAERARSYAEADVGVNQVTVSRVEQGVPVEYRSFLAIAQALGLDLAVLGVPAEDREEVAEEERLRLRMRAEWRAEGPEHGPNGSVKSASDYSLYGRLSDYRNVAVSAVGAWAPGLAGA